MRIALAAIVAQRLHSGDADAEIHQPFAPGATEGVGDKNGDGDASVLLQVAIKFSGRAVGIGGRSNACRPPSTLETSTPLLAQMNPCCVSVMRTPFLRRMMARLSRNASSITRASRWYFFAQVGIREKD